MERKLKLKEKIKVYITYQKPLKWHSCLMIIAVLFASTIILGYLIAPKETDAKDAENSSDVVFSAAFVGDIMFGRGIKSLSDYKGYDEVFKNTASFFKSCDYASANLESAVIDEKKKYRLADKELHINSKSDCIPAIKNAGFTVIGLSNNHVADYGRTALKYEMESFEKYELAYTGVGKNTVDSQKYDLQEVNGIKVATIAISDIIPKGFTATESSRGIFSTSNPLYLEIVRKASEKADITIVNMHWGDEYAKMPNDVQKEIGRNLIDNGADIIIGSHPHVLQPVETYNDGIIFYSLGSFVFDQAFSRSKDSAIVKYTVSESGERTFEIIPIRITDGIPAETSNALFTARIFGDLSKMLSSDSYTVSGNRMYIRIPDKVIEVSGDTTETTTQKVSEVGETTSSNMQATSVQTHTREERTTQKSSSTTITSKATLQTTTTPTTKSQTTTKSASMTQPTATTKPQTTTAKPTTTKPSTTQKPTEAPTTEKPKTTAKNDE